MPRPIHMCQKRNLNLAELSLLIPFWRIVIYTYFMLYQKPHRWGNVIDTFWVSFNRNPGQFLTTCKPAN
jgi:hypothetical protein